MPIQDCVTRRATPAWFLVLLPVLLSAALSIPQLGYDALNGDETIFVVTAGALQDGRRSLTEVWDNLPPRVAAGWPMLLSLWGSLVGWSEPAVRSLTCLVGLLTIASVYRAGRELFARPVGVVAAMLLSASVFHHAYMLNAVPYAGVALFTTLTIPGYWKVAMHPGTPGRWSQASLLTGSIGLAYSHFLAALFLPVLALYHLLFAPRGQNWWRACLLLALAAAAGAVQLTLLPEGWNFTENENLGSRSLSTRAVLSRLLYNLSNGILDVSVSMALIALVLALMVALAAGLKFRAWVATPWGFLITVGSALLVAVLIINEALVILMETRIRYLMPLWPLCALLAGAGLCWLYRKQRFLAATLLVFWHLQGSWFALATDFRYELGYFFRLDLHHLRRTISEIVPADDFLVVDRGVARQDERPYRYYHFQLMGLPYGIHDRREETPFETPGADLHTYPRIWLLYLTEDRAEMVDLPGGPGRVSCAIALERWGYTLEQLAHSERDCL